MHYVDRCDEAFKFVKARMPDESGIIVNGVVESLCKGETK
jgi:hypothetical protein